MKTMESIYQAITSAAESFGFRTERSSWNAAEITDDTHSVNFTVMPKPEWDFDSRTVSTSLTISASIATMGGNPTPDELLMRADAITRAANLCKTLNGIDLTYTITLNKED